MRSCSRSAAGVCATARLGLMGVAAGMAAVWNRATSPQADNASAAHSRAGAAQRLRLILPSRGRANSATSNTRVLRSVPADHFNLPHTEHFDARPAARLDPATDTNPSIFERLKDNSSRLERR